MAKSIMIQGTCSNAGKSLITAGLCRLFARAGYRTAPFKSQNMALNSYITKDGSEIGRAQAVQAEAAYREPDARMNPILLKPVGDMVSQVIVHGHVYGNIPAADYFKMKSALKPEVMKAYNSLAAENDMIVIEGAGSPAEINLLQDDIVNMGLAEMTGSPVLLVGDIDRGGVFASLYGTVALLEPESAYIKAVIINKFRGDIEILKPGLAMLEKLIHRPVAGVIPWMQVDIDDEDSLSDRLLNREAGGPIDIAVIRLPHISNFTDFNALARFPGFSVRYITHPTHFKNPDLVILPGTKNTIGDMEWLRVSGLEAMLLKYAQSNPLIGICGGYQMLTCRILDPECSETGGHIRGMGLLAGETRFENIKTQTQVVGRFQNIDGLFSVFNGASFKGYEIHMGQTASEDESAWISTLGLEDGTVRYDGLSDGNMVLGSYVHGLFDSHEVIGRLYALLSKRKGIAPQSEEQYSLRDYKESQYDLLADSLQASLDMDLIYRIIEDGIK